MTTPTPAHRPNAAGTAVAPLAPGPLGIGATFARAFSAIARNPRALILWGMLLPLAVHLLFAIPAAISDAAVGDLGIFASSAYGFDSQMLGVAALTGFAAFVQMVVMTLGTPVLHGFVASNLRLETLGYRGTARELWAHTRPALGRLLGFGCLIFGFSLAAGLAAGITAGLVTMLLVGIVAALSSSSMVAIVVTAAIIVIAVCVPILWLAARLSLAPSVIVFEGAPVWGSVRRSWALTRNRAWRIVGLQLLLVLIMAAAIAILTVICSLLAGAFFPFAEWEYGVTPQRVLASYLIDLPFSLIAAATSPITAALLATIYLDARVSTDWLATSLQHFHAGKALGYSPAQLADPFVTPPPAPPAPTPPQQSPPQAPQGGPQWAPRPTDPFDSPPQ